MLSVSSCTDHEGGAEIAPLAIGIELIPSGGGSGPISIGGVPGGGSTDPDSVVFPVDISVVSGGGSLGGGSSPETVEPVHPGSV